MTFHGCWELKTFLSMCLHSRQLIRFPYISTLTNKKHEGFEKSLKWDWKSGSVPIWPSLTESLEKESCLWATTHLHSNMLNYMTSNVFLSYDIHRFAIWILRTPHHIAFIQGLVIIIIALSLNKSLKWELEAWLK